MVCVCVSVHVFLCVIRIDDMYSVHVSEYTEIVIVCIVKSIVVCIVCDTFKMCYEPRWCFRVKKCANFELTMAKIVRLLAYKILENR